MNSQVGFPGIITCAHGFGTSTNNNIYSDANCTNSIGYRLKSQTSGNVDAAFVAINSPNQFINSCYGTGEAIRDGGYMSSPAVGSTVIKTGARTGTTKGVVVSTSATSITSDGTLTDLVKVNTLTGTGIAYNGDSGGIVFFSSSVNTVCGILNCGSPSATASSPSTYYYYVKAININKALNAAPY